ncbi:uncharacterized protein BYT42DRAFT_615340 [Radiomyces spectabilis]|uniref:uncharacterized protein n=1 Tax=Radiomyces spectabilis TaxID=64574 RepID=UPI00221E6291|nr:uncharacterized protein BYT42DRAFT_615340 [Radiomyces spectabilis]KAI8374150.1 hypothetical protein BYT42DRAFT_615340 [Radiomyces spectabilis]
MSDQVVNDQLLNNTQTTLSPTNVVDDDDADVHPQAYRLKRNSRDISADKCHHPGSHEYVHMEGVAQPRPIQTNPQDKAQWDLYPSMVRNIENDGTPEQVEQLHQMEHIQSL